MMLKELAIEMEVISPGRDAVRQCLLDGADWLESHDWCQGDGWTGPDGEPTSDPEQAVSACLTGALRIVAPTSVALMAVARVGAELNKDLPPAPVPAVLTTEWNDDKRRTKEQVIRILRDLGQRMTD